MIILGTIQFDPMTTAVRETHEEVGGRRERVIELSGIVADHSTEAAIQAAFDAILAAASTEEYTALLSLRQGRKLMVRRTEFTRNVAESALAGAFVLKLAAKDPFEISTALHTIAWPIAASGETFNPSSNGTAHALAVIELTAVGTVINPRFATTEDEIGYAGALADGDILRFDGVAREVTLNGVDVTPYTAGTFPQISPSGSVLTYTDDPSSSHTANVSIQFRDRWW